MGRLMTYSDQHVLAEGALFLCGCSIAQISKLLDTPRSTVSWHLIHPLKTLDYPAWIKVRAKLIRYGKNNARIREEQCLINSFTTRSL